LQSTRATREASFLVELFPSTEVETPAISMLGLEHSSCESVKPQAEPPRELCYKVEWENTAERQANGVDMQHMVLHGNRVVIVTNRSSSDDLVGSLLRSSESRTGVPPEISSLLDVHSYSGFFIVLLELDRELLSSISDAEWQAVRRLVGRCTGMLWVTVGASRVPTTPDSNMISGLLRTARSELACVAATLDLDPFSDLEPEAQAELVDDVFRRAVLSNEPSADMEFAEQDGSLVVPRLAVDADMNLRVHRELGQAAPYLQSYRQPGRHLRLRFETAGSLDSLYFDDDTSVGEQLDDHEVEIEVIATELTDDDVPPAPTGPSPTLVARSCSGVVSRLGHRVSNFSVHDRVCALAEGVLGTHARVHESSLVPIPDDMGFPIAATLPLVYSTAWYSLVILSRIRRGERVLIQLDGDYGLAAIHIAQSLGAKVFVAAGSNTTMKEALEVSGVPAIHVFDPSSIHFARLASNVTNGTGMDIVFTSTHRSQGSLRDLQKIWATVAPFGRVVHARGGQDGEHRRTATASIQENASVATVNMLTLGAKRPHIVANAIRDVMEWFTQEDRSRSMGRLLVLPMAKLKDGLLLAVKQPLGHVVVVSHSNDPVKVPIITLPYALCTIKW
jgi:NADPH:quinone reductase-like Zn-dependent oxidoreductase